MSTFDVLEGSIIISDKEYAELKEDQKLLRALQAGGVDNWEWYDASLEDHYESEDS